MIADRPWFLRAVILATIAFAGLWLWMLAVTIPHLSAIAGGLSIFDQRPFGYTLDDARALVSALGADGGNYYIDVQQRLDAFFPLLQVMTLSGWMVITARHLRQKGVAGLMTPTILAILLAMVGAVADYGENGAVRLILEGGVEGLNADLVSRASAMTQLKFGAGLLAFLVLAGMLALRFRQGRR